MNKKIVYILMILIFICAIIIVVLIAPNKTSLKESKNDTSHKPNSTKSYTPLTSDTPLLDSATPTPIPTLNSKAADEAKIWNDNRAEWKKKLDIYDTTAKRYRETFIEAVNTGDKSKIDSMVTKEFRQVVDKQIDDLRNNKVVFELKSFEVLSKESSQNIVIKTKEEIGMKKDGETEYKYSIYNKVYTIKKFQYGGILFDKEEG